MIWYVEDDASIRDIAIYALNSAGFETKGFEDGLSFWDAWVICSRRIYKTSDTRSEAAADSLWNCFPDPEWKSRWESIGFHPRSR